MATASPKAKFDAAVKVIHSLPKDGPFQPSREMMLTFYGYYKQATEGPCTSPKPSFWDLVKKAKWEAWSRLGDMDRETAMINYVEELKKTLKDCTKQWDEMSKNGDPRIVEAMPQTQVVGDFVQILGSFYEIVDEESPVNSSRMPNGGPVDEADAVPFDTDSLRQNGHPHDDENNTTTETSTSDTSTELDSEMQQHLQNSVPPENSNGIPVHSIQSEGRTGFPVEESTQPVQSSDSEEEFCDTSADLNVFQTFAEQQNGPISQSQYVPVKSGKGHHVRFADTNGQNGSHMAYHQTLEKTVHMAQGFPFISPGSGSSQEEIVFETSSPLNSAQCASSLNSDLHLALNVSNVSANNSNIVDVVDEGEESPCDEGEEPPDRGSNGDKEKDKNKKSGQGGSRSGSSRTNLQGGGGRRTLLSGGGSEGGAGGGEQDQGEGTDRQVNEQIALVLVRLQQDMANVLDRLNRLETQVGQRNKEDRPTRSSVFNWWPFSSRTGRTAFFFLIWPIIVHLLLTYLFRRRRKR